MKKKNKILLFSVIVIVLFFSSCERNTLTVSNHYAQTFMTMSSDMGFSFYINASISDEDKPEIQITSPDKTLKWVSALKKQTYGDLVYYGSSDFMMPDNSVLPKGEYSYTLICKDGRTSEGTFDLSYQKDDSIFDRVDTSNLPFFDSVSNITVIR